MLQQVAHRVEGLQDILLGRVLLYFAEVLVVLVLRVDCQELLHVELGLNGYPGKDVRRNFMLRLLESVADFICRHEPGFQLQFFIYAVKEGWNASMVFKAWFVEHAVHNGRDAGVEEALLLAVAALQLFKDDLKLFEGFAGGLFDYAGDPEEVCQLELLVDKVRGVGALV